MSVDLGAIPESLFEAELFGYTKGAFTDAKTDRAGRLQASNGGTLFLDEIGNLPLHLQAKLLTVLEQKQVTPVGGVNPIDIDVRVIAATNLPREQLTNDEYFRQDLLFRLNTVEILLPPLRERRDDIPALVSYYVQLYARKYGREVLPVSPDALTHLCGYAWPGNIRALRHAMERAVILAEGKQLEPADFALPASPDSTSKTAADIAGVAGPTSGTSSASGGNLNLEDLERGAIQTALTRHRYNISHAAKELGLTRAALYRRMEKYGL